MKRPGPTPAKTVDQIAAEIREAAREAPPIKAEHEQSMRAIIRRVATELEEMREKGYNMQALAKFLNEKGVAIAAPTLATYLRTFREEKAAASGSGGKQSGESSD